MLLPMVSLMLLPAPDLTLRFGGGYGYKTPTPFISGAEEIHFQNLQPINPDHFDAEQSKGVNVFINHRLELSETITLNSNLLLFYTEIEDAVDIASSGTEYVFEQQDDLLTSSGAELNLAFSLHDWRYFVGYTYIDAREETKQGDQRLPLVSRHRFNQVLVWEQEENFRVGLEAYYFSGILARIDSASSFARP